jgi:hypothetical protein
MLKERILNELYYIKPFGKLQKSHSRERSRQKTQKKFFLQNIASEKISKVFPRKFEKISYKMG